MTSREDILWAVDVGDWTPSAAEWEACLAALGSEAGADDERARIARFRRPIRVASSGGGAPETVWVEGRENPDARSALVGRLLLLAAARALVPGTRAVPCARTPHGRPYYARPWVSAAQTRHNCHTAQGGSASSSWWCPNANVSHHGRWVVLAGATRAVVGVDVLRRECRGAGPDAYVAALARGTLTARETAQTRDWARAVAAQTTLGGADARLDAFCTTWALKEALVKARGDGLAFDVQRADFAFAREHAVVADARNRVVRPAAAALEVDGTPQPAHRLAFRVYSPDSDHVVALCRAAPAAVTRELQDTLPAPFGVAGLPDSLPDTPWPPLRIFPSVSSLLHEFWD